MMEIKFFLPLHDLPQYSIERQLDAVEKQKKGPELFGESPVYMIEVCLCFGVAEPRNRVSTNSAHILAVHHRFKLCTKSVI
jgi:hypothetical protein